MRSLSYFLPPTAPVIHNCCKWWYVLKIDEIILKNKTILFSNGMRACDLNDGCILGRPWHQAFGGRGWATTGITLMPPSLLWGIGLTCSCRTDALLTWGRIFSFLPCNRLLLTLRSFILFSKCHLIPCIKKDFDLELMHTLKREIVRCSVCCNINAVIFSLYNPLFLLHLIAQTGTGCLLSSAIDPSPEMLQRYKYRLIFMLDVILSTYWKQPIDLMLKMLLEALFTCSLRI